MNNIEIHNLDNSDNNILNRDEGTLIARIINRLLVEKQALVNI
jgi:hypothetical protein